MFGFPLPIVALAIALALSLAGNAFLWHSRDSLIEEKAAMEASRDQWKNSADACSAATDLLTKEAATRKAEVDAAFKAGVAAARAKDAQAQGTMQRRAAVPGDACASARALNRDKLGERRKAGQ